MQRPQTLSHSHLIKRLEHLTNPFPALERTYLAYMRTASAYGQLGVTLSWLFRLNIYTKANNTPTTLKVGKAMGATVEIVAIIVMLLGAAYFAKQQMGLMSGKVVSRGYEIWVMGVLSLVVGAEMRRDGC